ncbi:uncharacterized protein H6S33_003801 [Morchella sextelata]|uniref:uncharacterized protein n=1 Tax=Morchella sextelata TaxID=1174677 RepID=UPI001D036BC5|nr:uncharacterized protein H6S33_003801 [Morchella sextelata]KAH0606140.1 hypothetical protein H6S33_003801 [Morchella sextelata]
MDQTHIVDSGPVTPKARRMSGSPMSNNTYYRGDQGRFPAVSHTTYADSGYGGRGQNAAVEEIDNSCVVYVNGLTNLTDDRILFDTFRQFGSIVSLVRRSVNYDARSNDSMTQYAFIGFSNPQDAQDAVQKGEITLGDRKLTIKPRDKPGVSYHKSIYHGHHHHHSYKGFKDRPIPESREQILQLLNKNRTGHPIQQNNAIYGQKNQSPPHEQQQMQQMQTHDNSVLAQLKNDNMDPTTLYGGFSGPSGPRSSANNNNTGHSPVLMSKALYVANLPIDMSPKELFTLFSEVGLVEGCYIFPYADSANRRFGDIVMSSFYCAQKACEAFDGTVIRGCVLAVSYKTHPGPDVNHNSPPPMQFNPAYPPPLPQPFPPSFPQQFQQPVNFGPPMYHPGPFGPQGQQMAWLPQNYGPSNPNMVASASMIPFAHQFPPLQNMAQYSPFNVMSPISPQGFEIQHIGGMSPPGSPPFQSFQDPITGWQGQIPPRAILGRHYHNRRYNGRGGRMNNRLPANFSNTEHHRSTSNSSSTTLASHGYDRPRFDGTVTVNGSFMGSTITSESYRSPPPVIGGSFTSSCETPSRNSFDGNTSESDKDSTPSPVVIRTLPDPKLGPETPTKSSSHPTVFVALSAPIIPETTDPADPANLYIKNLDPSIISTGEDLKKLFEPFGTVSSFVLATYPNTSISRGYGFVAFLKPEDAIAAKAKLDRSIVGSRRVFVTWAETKEVRTKRLKDLFNGNGGANEKDNTADKIEKARLEDGGLTHQSEKQNESEIIGESVDTSTKIPPSQPKEDVREHGAVGKNTEKTSEDDVPLMVAEQEIAVTNRWRGTQLTGIAEVVEDEEVSRSVIQRVDPGPSSGSSYKAPCIVRSSTLGRFDNPPESTQEPKNAPSEKSNQQFSGDLANELSAEHGNSAQVQNQSQAQNSKNGNDYQCLGTQMEILHPKVLSNFPQ